MDRATNDYVRIWAPNHPLRDGRGTLWQHRAVLFETIGPGSHQCHWCERLVTWRARRGAPEVDDLVVDHLDGNRSNNEPSNLVPACQPCNVAAGYNPRVIDDGEVHIVRKKGTRLRAVERVCAQCGATFLKEPSASPTYCSRACTDAAKRRTVCRRGHPRTPENLTKANQCRECMRIAYRAYHARQAAARTG